MDGRLRARRGFVGMIICLLAFGTFEDGRGGLRDTAPRGHAVVSVRAGEEIMAIGGGWTGSAAPLASGAADKAEAGEEDGCEDEGNRGEEGIVWRSALDIASVGEWGAYHSSP